jgi:hypothetical protein
MPCACAAWHNWEWYSLATLVKVVTDDDPVSTACRILVRPDGGRGRGEGRGRGWGGGQVATVVVTIATRSQVHA